MELLDFETTCRTLYTTVLIVVFTEHRNIFSEMGRDQSHSNITLAIYESYMLTIDNQYEDDVLPGHSGFWQEFTRHGFSTSGSGLLSAIDWRILWAFGILWQQVTKKSSTQEPDIWHMVFVFFAVFYESNEEPGSSVGNASSEGNASSVGNTSSVFKDRNLLLAVFLLLLLYLPLTPRLTPTQHSWNPWNTIHCNA